MTPYTVWPTKIHYSMFWYLKQNTLLFPSFTLNFLFLHTVLHKIYSKFSAVFVYRLQPTTDTKPYEYKHVDTLITSPIQLHFWYLTFYSIYNTHTHTLKSHNVRMKGVHFTFTPLSIMHSLSHIFSHHCLTVSAHYYFPIPPIKSIHPRSHIFSKSTNFLISYTLQLNYLWTVLHNIKSPEETVSGD